MADRPTLVVVGAATRDLDGADPRGWRLGGTVTYAALVATRLGARVRALIGVDHESAAARELDLLRDEGVDVGAVALERGPVFDNRQSPAGRVQYATPSDKLPADALPVEWRHPDAAILGPVAGELGSDWASAFEPPTLVSLAAQGLMRHLPAGQPVERVALARSPLVERADTIFVSAEDVAGADVDLHDIIWPSQQLVVTHGDRGALALRLRIGGATGRYVPALPSRAPMDTTGAGDTFLSAYVVGQLLFRRDAAALILASAAAGLSVERASLADLPTHREVCEVLVRLRGGQSRP